MIKPAQKPRIWVDFQNSDPQRRVRLTCVGTVEELGRLGVVLKNGLELTLYCLEFEAEAVVEYSTEEKRWTARVDWENIRELEGNTDTTQKT